MKILLNLADGRSVAVLDPKDLELFGATPPDVGRDYTPQVAQAITGAKAAVRALLDAAPDGALAAQAKLQG